MKYPRSNIACPYPRTNVFDEHKASTRQTLNIVRTVALVRASMIECLDGSFNLKAYPCHAGNAYGGTKNTWELHSMQPFASVLHKKMAHASNHS